MFDEFHINQRDIMLNSKDYGQRLNIDPVEQFKK